MLFSWKFVLGIMNLFLKCSMRKGFDLKTHLKQTKKNFKKAAKIARKSVFLLPFHHYWIFLFLQKLKNQ